MALPLYSIWVRGSEHAGIGRGNASGLAIAAATSPTTSPTSLTTPAMLGAVLYLAGRQGSGLPGGRAGPVFAEHAVMTPQFYSGKRGR